MTGRNMVSYDMAQGRFNFRAAAIILRDGHILVQRAQEDNFWALPGGRVEWGESTEFTLAREIEEELGVSGAVGPLAVVMERFFTFADTRFHELAYYFPVTLPESFPFVAGGEICHRVIDGAAHLEFCWLPYDGESLSAHNFVPPALREHFSSFDPALRHFVETDQPWETAP